MKVQEIHLLHCISTYHTLEMKRASPAASFFFIGGQLGTMEYGSKAICYEMLHDCARSKNQSVIGHIPRLHDPKLIMSSNCLYK